MKLINQRKHLLPMKLQFFADGGDGDTDQDDNSGDDGNADQDDNGGDNDKEEKTFTQADIDNAVEKRLKRERRKWEKEKDTKKDDKADDDKDKGVDKDILAKAEKAEALETKLLCYEQGVDKDSVDDVVALAKAYVNDDTDIEDAIEKVLKKYPQFKVSTKNEDDESDNQKGSWGDRQKGTSKKLSGVEAAFQNINPNLKL